jgi:hypothetical protein
VNANVAGGDAVPGDQSPRFTAKDAKDAKGTATATATGPLHRPEVTMETPFAFFVPSR